MSDLLFHAVRDIPAFVLYDDKTRQAICRRCGVTYLLSRGLGEWSSAVGLKVFGSEHQDCLLPTERVS
jgi:hypothetical protein